MKNRSDVKRATTRFGRYFPISSTLIDIFFLTNLVKWSDPLKFPKKYKKHWRERDEQFATGENKNGVEEMIWYFGKLIIYIFIASFIIFFVSLIELPTTAVYGVLHDLTFKLFGKWNWFFRIIAVFITFAVYIAYMTFVGENIDNIPVWY